MRIHFTRRLTLVTVTTVAAAAVATTALAAIPAGDGQVHACVAKAARTSPTGVLGPTVTLDRAGTLRAIDADHGQTCASDEQPLTFNVQGAKGDTGPPGPPGNSTVANAVVVTHNATGHDDVVDDEACPTGDVATGGGLDYAIGTGGAQRETSAPSLSPSGTPVGWRGQVLSADSGAFITMDVYVICVPAS
jgi:hypothetical protein